MTLADTITPGTDWTDGTDRTDRLGESPAPPPTCANCGKPIGQDDVVCPHCGVSLAGG